MNPRLTRAQQSERNRALVLGAARGVFLDRGYHGATVDEIAEQAGFSKGVVYSQFGNKADLFMALLEDRIDERAQANAALTEGLAGERGVAEFIGKAVHADRAEPAWNLLLIEFRVHAARDPELNKRYAVAHERTIERLAALFSGLYERAGQEPPLPVGLMAEAAFAFSWGAQLEHATNPDALPAPLVAELAARLVGRPPAGDAEGLT
jgi:AcrR family transcriptional regulator